MWIVVPTALLHGPYSLPGSGIYVFPSLLLNVCTGFDAVSNADMRSDP
jgi:hypothetical protein